jgi:hypothetical protein
MVTQNFPETGWAPYKIYSWDHDLICTRIDSMEVVFAKRGTVVET